MVWHQYILRHVLGWYYNYEKQRKPADPPLCLYTAFYFICHWVGAVYPAQTELKISRFNNSRWWNEGEAKLGKRERKTRTFLTCLSCSVLTKKEILLKEAATLFMRNEVLFLENISANISTAVRNKVPIILTVFKNVTPLMIQTWKWNWNCCMWKPVNLLLDACLLFLERERVRDCLCVCVCVCVCQIWSRPPGAEGLQSTVRTATSGQPTDSWLPQMMHWPWHPNWPQCLSQGAWRFCMRAPMCVCACVYLCLSVM